MEIQNPKLETRVGNKSEFQNSNFQNLVR